MTTLGDLLANEPDHRPADPGAVSTSFFDLDISVGGWHPGLILLADNDQGRHLASVLAYHFVPTVVRGATSGPPRQVLGLERAGVQSGLIHVGTARRLRVPLRRPAHQRLVFVL